ncbi:DNA-directed RNA polymerase II subunit RPB4 ASCRUDRAFT_7743 [Ascoidea rubescens DSM 1968]|uniref:RNA polymerase Rpb4/RPC9 core domain-containing protein n=1 Tax=Ascoidea rubescens DSM 1968 TaxID=1344418 RepID=A0A1D2VIR4_9ASCO|nr:hypothetical protein ASCRUDRAFT_7743 [Ascoidea rubescens DSM 1968]ODV61522.1 hypothetical protein ASCRUDRAFT_7743 [Ascoidea rubescens DSM 1968]
MNVTSSLGVRRRKRAQNLTEEEDATKLQLGEEFSLKRINQDGEESSLIALNLSEARILIREALKERKRQLYGEDSFTRANPSDPNNPNDDDIQNDDELITNVALTPNANEILKKTLHYLSYFARFRDEQSCTAVDNLLKNENHRFLHPFEIAQLGSLSCDTAEEAKTLIPSLNDKVREEDLQSVLDQLNSYETPN